MPIGRRERPRFRLPRRLPAPLLAAVAGIALASCGGGEEPTAVAPEDCLQSWNAESASLRFGRHVYDSHRSTQAQVTMLEPPSGAIDVSGGRTCAVVFAVARDDPEYGDVGLVVTRSGWASLREIAPGDEARLDEIQSEAIEAVNANLFPDGSLAQE